jgi:hypothetical protein
VKRIPVEFFLMTLGASSSTYVEATATQQLPDWIASHTRAFAYYGACAGRGPRSAQKHSHDPVPRRAGHPAHVRRARRALRDDDSPARPREAPRPGDRGSRRAVDRRPASTRDLPACGGDPQARPQSCAARGPAGGGPPRL